MKKLFYISVLCYVFIACQKDKPMDNSKSLDIECYSRSNTEEKVKVTDFSMYVYGNDGLTYNNVSNPIHVTYSDGWVFPEVKISEAAGIYAISPFIETTDCSNISLFLNPQTDYLATNGVVSATVDTPSVSFTLEHILSKVNVIIDGSSDCSVSIKKLPISASYNLKTNSLVPGTTQGIINSNTSSVMFFPCTASIDMIITYNSHSYQYTAISNTYLRGKEYTYNLTIDDTQELSISGDIEVTDWINGGDYEGTVQE